MAKTRFYGLPTDTHGLISLRNSFERAMAALDAKVADLEGKLFQAVGTLSSQSAASGAARTFTLPTTAFKYGVAPLAYSATKSDDTALPTGITFDPATRVLTLAATVAAGAYAIKFTATDAAGNTVTQALTYTLT